MATIPTAKLQPPIKMDFL